MPGTPAVELVYYSGCPLVGAARVALRTAMAQAGMPAEWQEWDQLSPGAPDHTCALASPTILVAGRDVMGANTPNSGLACRADGIPAPEVIAAALGAPPPIDSSST